MPERFRTIPRATFTPELFFVLPYFLGFFLCSHFGFAFYEKCGITGWEFWGVVGGIVLMAWTWSYPFTLKVKLRKLEARIRILEEDPKRVA